MKLKKVNLKGERLFCPKAAALLLALGALLPASGAGKSEAQFNVATYNLRYYAESDSLQGELWQRRSPAMAGLINFHGFDIFGTQEGLKFQLEDMKRLLPGYEYIGGGRTDGKNKGEHAAIFFRTDLFELLNSGDFWLSETPERPGKGWDAVLPRICTWGHFKHRGSGREFLMYNVHLDHIGTKARVESMKLVMRRATENPGRLPVFITGDFNVDQTSDCYETMAKSGVFFDTHEVSPVVYEPNGTWNEWNTSGFTNSRIDHIFVSPGVEVKRYGILTDSYRTLEGDGDSTQGTGGYDCEVLEARPHLPSDHFPVLTTVVLK